MEHANKRQDSENLLTSDLRTSTSPTLRWLQAYVHHVRQRGNSRVVLRARVDGAAPIAVQQLYAVEGGGLVLVVGEEEEAYELWVASQDQIVFEARPAPEGQFCTGFGYLGLSRTPRVLVPRGTEPPPHVGHHEHDDF